ncbi:uncharacterized protein LOC131679016 [Topomyia yanbarensis]|uniref:uncharacterized protein LOC131679016 n=1 Tax=Topomyia yanbarensis TaxID=2498891 RepID=UPI00273CDB7F|nr:uncharacterized protein LOC131679016 [Topomyia yanbarensis]
MLRYRRATGCLSCQPRKKMYVKPQTLKQLKAEVHDLRGVIRNLRLQLRVKEQRFKKFEKETEKKINDLELGIEQFRKSAIDIQSVSKQSIKDEVRSSLQKIFTVNQTDLILGEKKKVVWTAEEIALAFSLRYHSQPAYSIVRSEMKIPLPCLRSLREWASCIEMRRGILNDVFTVLKIAGKHMSARERVVVLGYDEVSVNGTVEYDKRNDSVIGPHKEMQVVSARGLFGK